MTHSQTVDLGISRCDVAHYLVATGYWNSPQENGNRRYTLSPSAYRLSREQQTSLNRLALWTYNAIMRLNAYLCDLAKANGLSHQDGMFLKLANSASRGLLRPEYGCMDISPVLKIDVMQSVNGRFQIAEVDAYNPRGLGYNALLNDLFLPVCQASGSGVEQYPGMGMVAEMLKSRYTGPWHIVLSEYERYYGPAFSVFAKSMARHGVEIRIVRDSDMAHILEMTNCNAHLLIIPDTLHTYAKVRELLMGQYVKGGVTPFIPPVAYLGSKAFLPFLRSCDGMEEFMPECGLVGKRWSDPREKFGGPYVLKAGVSSGLKDVYFSRSDVAEFERAFAGAREQKTGSWVLQQEVVQQRTPVVVFDEAGKRLTRDYYVRLTLQIGARGVIDAEITGCTTPKVHGTPECIQLPVVLE